MIMGYTNDLVADDNKNFINKDGSGVANKFFAQNNIIRSVEDAEKVEIRNVIIDHIKKDKPVVKNVNKIDIVQERFVMLKDKIKNRDSSNPYNNISVNVVTWADMDRRTKRCWGDYWVKQMLYKNFEKLGCNVEVPYENCDITVYLFGSPFPYRKNKRLYNPLSFNVMWFYSHPDKLTSDEAIKYDLIHCLSDSYIPIVKKIHNNVYDFPLYSCTDFKKVKNVKYGTDNSIVMVANARGAGAPYGRKVIKLLKKCDLEDINVKVWGHKWTLDKYGKFPMEWYVDKYYDYNKLNTLYRKAKAVIIDGHDSMEHFGFVPMKLFDVLGSGGYPIIKYNKGIKKIFKNVDIATFKNSKELQKRITELKDRKRCLKIIKDGKKIIKDYCHNYNSRAITILESSISEITKLGNNVLTTETINSFISNDRSDKFIVVD